MSAPRQGSLYVAAFRGPPFRVCEQGPLDYLTKKWADKPSVIIFEVVPTEDATYVLLDAKDNARVVVKRIAGELRIALAEHAGEPFGQDRFLNDFVRTVRPLGK